jgi:ribosome biogenesis GTPase
MARGITLEDLGYDNILDQFRKEKGLDGYDIGRITAEHKERYIVRTARGEFDAEVTGNIRHTAKDRSDFPAVGDWVAVTVYDDNLAIIYGILPRRSLLERQAVGKFGEKQVIAANIDYAFIVQSVERDFNINRIERYLAISYSAKTEPVIVLSKTDLISEDELCGILEKLNARIKNIEIIPVSNSTKKGLDKLELLLIKGMTYCFLGSSGVGKSTLINNLAGKEIMRTREISESTKKGKHTTEHRELFVLEQGGILIDNPGMREVGIAEASAGLEITFDLITKLSGDCKFADCTHTNETGCVVIEAVNNGEIDKASYNNFLKMEREKVRFQESVAEKRKKDKAFGKICREGAKLRKRNKY